MAEAVSRDVAGLQAAQELEIRVRQLRFHCFLYLADPRPDRLQPVAADEQHFVEALAKVGSTADTPEERACVAAITGGFQQYREELAQLRRNVAAGRPTPDLGRLADAHPVRHVVDPCEELVRRNQESLQAASQESERVGSQAHLVMLLVGIAGPLG